MKTIRLSMFFVICLGLTVMATDTRAELSSKQSESEISKCIGDNATTTKMRECTVDDNEKQDKRLNAIWKKLYSNSNERQKKYLLAEQRAWLRYHREACGLIGDQRDFGTMGLVLSNNCSGQILFERIKLLESYLKLYELDE